MFFKQRSFARTSPISLPFIEKYRHQIELLSYPPIGRILILYATHTDSPLRLETMRTSLPFLQQLSKDIIIINSKDQPYNDTLKQEYETQFIQYYEIDNVVTYDFGKWIYGLDRAKLEDYDYVVFSNDSFIIHEDIRYFVNKGSRSNVELFGFNDSSVFQYHYQSYLFMIRTDAIPKFRDMYEAKKDTITSQHDLIHQYELNMTHHFTTHACFLHLANLPGNEGRVVYMNPPIYKTLRENHLLPFTKLKQLVKISP